MSTKTDELMRLAGNCRECYAYYLSVPASKKPAAKREMDEADAALRSAIQEVLRDAEIGRKLMAQQWFWEDGRDMAPCGRYWLSIAVDTTKGRPPLPEIIAAWPEAS